MKRSLKDRCENYLSNDWLPKDAGGSKTFPVKGFYVEPDWTRTVKGGLEDEHERMGKLCDIFDRENDKVLAEGISDMIILDGRDRPLIQ